MLRGTQHDRKCRVEGKMLYLIMLVIFLIQFLVIFGVLMFVIFLARPEVPFSDKDSEEWPAKDDRDHRPPRPPEGKPPTSGKNISRSSSKPTKQVMATRLPALAALRIT
jgi:hypothetical protein